MKLKVLYIVMALCLIFCSGCADQQQFAPSSDIGIRSGDLIFRRGDSKESYIVRIADQNEGFYSHCGVVVEINGELFAIHSVPDEVPENEVDRVKCEPLTEFFHPDRALNGAVYRTPLTSEELERVSLQARYHYAVGTPFDGQFILEDTTELYCTEFLQHIFLKVDYDLASEYASHNPIPLSSSDLIIFPCDLIKNQELTHIYSY